MKARAFGYLPMVEMFHDVLQYAIDLKEWGIVIQMMDDICKSGVVISHTMFHKAVDIFFDNDHLVTSQAFEQLYEFAIVHNYFRHWVSLGIFDLRKFPGRDKRYIAKAAIRNVIVDFLLSTKFEHFLKTDKPVTFIGAPRGIWKEMRDACIAEFGFAFVQEPTTKGIITFDTEDIVGYRAANGLTTFREADFGRYSHFDIAEYVTSGTNKVRTVQHYLEVYMRNVIQKFRRNEVDLKALQTVLDYFDALKEFYFPNDAMYMLLCEIFHELGESHRMRSIGWRPHVKNLEGLKVALPVFLAAEIVDASAYCISALQTFYGIESEEYVQGYFKKHQPDVAFGLVSKLLLMAYKLSETSLRTLLDCAFRHRKYNYAADFLILYDREMKPADSDASVFLQILLDYKIVPPMSSHIISKVVAEGYENLRMWRDYALFSASHDDVDEVRKSLKNFKEPIFCISKAVMLFDVKAFSLFLSVADELNLTPIFNNTEVLEWLIKASEENGDPDMLQRLFENSKASNAVYPIDGFEECEKLLNEKGLLVQN